MPRLRGSALVVLQKDSRDKASMLQQLFDEIYIKDILRRHGVRKKRGTRDNPFYVHSSFFN